MAARNAEAEMSVSRDQEERGISSPARNSEGVERGVSRDQEDRVISSSSKNSLMVVASILAAIALQVAVQPPGGLADKSYKSLLGKERPGSYITFMYFNGLALFSAIHTIWIAAYDLELRLELHVCTFAIGALVGSAYRIVTPDEIQSWKILVFLLLLPTITISLLILVFRYRK